MAYRVAPFSFQSTTFVLSNYIAPKYLKPTISIQQQIKMLVYVEFEVALWHSRFEFISWNGITDKSTHSVMAIFGQSSQKS